MRQSDALSMALVNNERLAALLHQWLCDPRSLDADEVECTLMDCGYAPEPETLCASCANKECLMDNRTATSCVEYKP